MARRTQLYRVMPWVGGINTSVDPGVLNPQQLVQADNVQFSSTGARIKREAFEYLDPEIPAPTQRSSSGTIRTLRFAQDTLVTTVPLNEKLVVGERITVSGVANYAATDVPVLTRTEVSTGVYEITYEAASSLTEGLVSAGAITITRASSVISITDYWRYDGSGGNTQLLVYATDDFQLFYIDGGGRRVQILGQPQVTEVVTLAASSITTGDYFLLNGPNNTNNFYVWYNKDAGGGDPAVAGRTGIEVTISTGQTAAQVATATAAAIDATEFSASAVSDVVTITASAAGITSDAADGNTGFQFQTAIPGATAPLTAVSTIRTLVYNERLILCLSGLGNKPIVYNPDINAKYQLLSEDAPDASFMFQHQGRLWANDKTERDRLHYSETFDHTLWLGIGDSGAIDIAPGDGDPEGILNGYTYKGFAVIAKKNSRHRILGDSPENYFRELISDGLGNEGPLAIPVDETDVVFISRRGVHSQQATDAYGDTDAAYLSADIQPTVNSWEAEDLKLMQGAYIPELNSIALSVTEDGQQSPNSIWLYNLEAQVPGKQRPGEWYRWPDISCTALSRRFTAGKHKLVIGTRQGRLIQAQKQNDFADFGEAGIPFTLKTGTIYPGENPQSMKAFKKISMIYRPRGNFTFTVLAKIDNFRQQSFAFNQISGLDLLGETFVLGNSILGSSNTLAPYTFTMEGIGRGVQLTVSQPTADEQVEIWGFIIEYEDADVNQATDEQ